MFYFNDNFRRIALWVSAFTVQRQVLHILSEALPSCALRCQFSRAYCVGLQELCDLE